MLREVAASVRLVLSLRAVAWAKSQPAVQAQMRRDPTLLHYSASIARSKCKNTFGVKTPFQWKGQRRKFPSFGGVAGAACSGGNPQ